MLAWLGWNIGWVVMVKYLMVESFWCRYLKIRREARKTEQESAPSGEDRLFQKLLLLKQSRSPRTLDTRVFIVLASCSMKSHTHICI